MIDYSINKRDDLIAWVKKIDSSLNDQRIELRDYWDCDLISVGIINREKEGFLVYLSLTGAPLGSIFYELESPPVSSDQVYISSGEGYVKLPELLDVIRNHLFAD